MDPLDFRSVEHEPRVCRISNRHETTRSDRKLLPAESNSQMIVFGSGDDIEETLLKLEVSHIEGTGSGLAAGFPEAAELGESAKVRTNVQVRVRQQACGEGCEAVAKRRQTEELVIVALHALPHLGSERQVSRFRVVERNELELLEEIQTGSVSEKAVVLSPTDCVDLVSDGALPRTLGPGDLGSENQGKARAKHRWASGDH